MDFLLKNSHLNECSECERSLKSVSIFLQQVAVIPSIPVWSGQQPSSCCSCCSLQLHATNVNMQSRFISLKVTCAAKCCWSRLISRRVGAAWCSLRVNEVQTGFSFISWKPPRSQSLEDLSSAGFNRLRVHAASPAASAPRRVPGPIPAAAGLDSSHTWICSEDPSRPDEVLSS